MRLIGLFASALSAGIVSGIPFVAVDLAYAGVTIRLATEATSLDPTFELANKFKELLEARARDALDVKFFSGGALGTQRQAQEQVHLGAVEAISTASDMPELETKFGIFDFPFLFSERQHVYKVLDGPIGEELNQTLIRNKGVRVLAYGELGFRHFTNSVRPIAKPDDLKGLKIRVPPAKIRVAAIRAMGAAATPMPWKEVYTSLQQRVVDGQENPIAAIHSISLWEVQKFISLTSHIYTPVYLLINERFYQSLAPELRRTVQEAATEAKAWQRAENQRNEERDLRQARDRGMQVNTADLKAFAAVTRPVWEEFSGLVGKELLERVNAARP